jgi:hypothetical protein
MLRSSIKESRSSALGSSRSAPAASRLSAAGVIVNACARTPAAYARPDTDAATADRSQLHALWERVRVEIAREGSPGKS